MTRKLVMVRIEANGRYCLNTCDYMSLDAKRCNLFDRELTWNYRKTKNGNMRPEACRKAEVEKQP